MRACMVKGLGFRGYIEIMEKCKLLLRVWGKRLGFRL